MLNSLLLIKRILTFLLWELDELSLLIERTDSLLENLRHLDRSLGIAIKCLYRNSVALMKLFDCMWNFFLHAQHFVAKEEVSINEARLISIRLIRLLLENLLLLWRSTNDLRLGFLLGLGLIRFLLCSLISLLSALVSSSTLSWLSLDRHLRIFWGLLRCDFLERNHRLVWSRRSWTGAVILGFFLLINRWDVDGSYWASFHQEEWGVSIQDAMVNHTYDLEGRVR